MNILGSPYVSLMYFNSSRKPHGTEYSHSDLPLETYQNNTGFYVFLHYITSVALYNAIGHNTASFLQNIHDRHRIRSFMWSILSGTISSPLAPTQGVRHDFSRGLTTVRVVKSFVFLCFRKMNCICLLLYRHWFRLYNILWFCYIRIWQFIHKYSTTVCIDFARYQMLGIECFHVLFYRSDSRFAPSQWETSLQSNTVSHWLGANLESALVSYQTLNEAAWKYRRSEMFWILCRKFL